MLDFTIGQLNSAEFDIDFKQPYLASPVTQEFLLGQSWLPVESEGMMVCYKAFPAETTYLQSESWSNPAYRKAQEQAADGKFDAKK